MNQIRESSHIDTLLGTIAPLLLMAFIVFEWWTGKAYLPRRRGIVQTVMATDNLSLFVSLLMVEFAITVGLFNWYFLALRPAHDKLVPVVGIGAATIFATGLLGIGFNIVVIFLRQFS